MTTRLTEELKSWIGREVTYVAPDELSKASIRLFALATGDCNPLYCDEAIARETYRPDLYRKALAPLGVALPGANAKVEGALKSATPVGTAGASLILGPDGFFDGALFDPDRIDAYIAAQVNELAS